MKTKNMKNTQTTMERGYELPEWVRILITLLKEQENKHATVR
jgi:hypothetical protein